MKMPKFPDYLWFVLLGLLMVLLYVQNIVIDHMDREIRELQEQNQTEIYRGDILKLKLIHCEDEYLKLDKQSTLCWEELAEILP